MRPNQLNQLDNLMRECITISMTPQPMANQPQRCQSCPSNKRKRRRKRKQANDDDIDSAITEAAVSRPSKQAITINKSQQHHGTSNSAASHQNQHQPNPILQQHSHIAANQQEQSQLNAPWAATKHQSGSNSNNWEDQRTPC